MPTTTSDLFSIQTVRELVVEPLFQSSVALRTLRRVETQSTEYYLPKVEAGQAAFVAELAPLQDAAVAAEMLRVVPKKVGAIQTVSAESASDANAAQIVGEALVAALADEVDKAFFVGAGPTGPAGLPGVAGVQTEDADPQSGLDPYSNAVSLIEAAGGRAAAIYLSPATWAALASLKTEAGSNQPVLSPQGGLGSEQQRALFGVAVHVSRHVDDAEAYVVDTSRTIAVVRQPFRVEVAREHSFNIDGVDVRAIGRVEFASVYPETIVKVAEAGE